MSHKNTFRPASTRSSLGGIFVRKLSLSSFLAVVFFLASSVLAASNITFSSLTLAYKNYVSKPVIVSTPQPPASPLSGGSVVASPDKGRSGGVSDATLLSAIQKVINQPSIAAKLRGPIGPTGPAGSSPMYVGQAAASLQPSSPAPIPAVFVPVGISQPDLAHNFSGASYFSATNLSSNLLTAATANVTDITVSGSSVLKGSLDVTGSTTLTALTAGTISGNVSGALNPNLTLGSVYFQGASGLTQDNANLFWDATNHRLGIGTTTPQNKLDIDAGAGDYLRFSNGGTIVGLVGQTANNSKIGWFDLRDNGIVKVTIVASGNSFFNGGNVGIGIANPASLLEVGTSTGGILSISTNNGAGTSGTPLYQSLQFLGYSDLVKARIRSSDKRNNVYGGELLFSVSDNIDDTLQDRMIITSAGNVGIGTTSPATKLDVNGNIYVNSNIYNTGYITSTPDKNQQISTLPLQRTWTDSGYTQLWGITWEGGEVIYQPQIIKQGGVYYIFVERLDYEGGNGEYRIDVFHAVSLAGPWTRVEGIVTHSTTPGDPDYGYVADPSVLYIPWAEHKWQMWFDMLANYEVAGTDIGHAYADNPLGPWTKQATGGVTDIVIGRNTSFGSFGVTSAHAPECFLYAGVVNCLYQAQGTGHTSYDVMLAVASDSQGLGHSFEKWGPVTTDTTIVTGDANRMQSVFAYNDVLYSMIENTAYAKGYWISSHDGGRSWQQMGESALPFHSFLVENNKIWGITQTAAAGAVWPFAMKFYYLDLENLTGSVLMSSLAAGSHTNLPYVSNVYNGYYIQGDTGLYRSAANVFRTAGSLIVDGSVGIGVVSPNGTLSSLNASATIPAGILTTTDTTDATTHRVLRLNTGASATTATTAEFIGFFAGSTLDNNGTGAGNIHLTGGGAAGVTYATGSADFAEYFEKSGDNLDQGDVVSLGTDSKVSRSSADQNVIGVVSKTAAFVGNWREDNSNRVVIGLLGQMPVKVSEENGSIHPGDRLTISKTKAGSAMKMTESGQSIGIALENSTPGMDKISVFVNINYQMPDLNLETVAGTITPLPGSPSESFAITFFTNIKNKISAWLAEAGNGVAKIFVGEVDSNNIKTNTLCIGSTCVTENQLKSILAGAGSPSTNSGSGDVVNNTGGNTPPATCSDGIQNQDETGIDIGGICASASVSVTLQSIAVTTPATKLSYLVGETLDITGLQVTGIYSDATTKIETLTVDNISGFDNSTPVTGQILTITVGGKTTTYLIDVI